MKIDDRIIHVQNIRRLTTKNGQKKRGWLRRRRSHPGIGPCRCCLLLIGLWRHPTGENDEWFTPRELPRDVPF